MLAVSALLPELSQADVRRVMAGLEASVGNGFHDVPLAVTWPMVDEMRRARLHHRLAHPQPRVAADGVADDRSPRSSRDRSGSSSSRLGEPIDHFAYPGGQFTPRRRRGGGARRLSVRVHGLPARRSAPSAADDRAPAAVGRLVGRRRRRVLAGILSCQAHDLWPPARRCERVHRVMSARNARTDVTRPARAARRGRVIGLVASFAIGIVLARIFAPAEFGTYKQFFLRLRDAVRPGAARHGREPLLLRAAQAGAHGRATSATRSSRSRSRASPA